MGLDVGGAGRWVVVLVVASQVAALAPTVAFVVGAPDGPGDIALTVLFGALALAVGIGAWRRWRGAPSGDGAGRPGDVTYDPTADPGHAARERWERAVRRLPGHTGDDDDD
jgi:hypothetical protein